MDFVSGEVTNSKKLRNDMLEKYQDKELKSFSCISADPDGQGYYSKLTVAGYSSADILIIPSSVLEDLQVISIWIILDY